MDMIHQTHEAVEYAPNDYISRMPDNVIGNILDRLPLQDAVRTDTLSKDWRFKWTLLSQLIFDDKFYAYLLETKNEMSYGRIISRLLNRLKGVITKFVLSIDASRFFIFDDQDISCWVFMLSQNGIKDLTLERSNRSRLVLPVHLFNCLELKHLKLGFCKFDPPSNFDGFPNLLSLELRAVRLVHGKFGDFFTRCPVLEILKLDMPFLPCKITLAELEKLKNLKTLSLRMSNLENYMIISSHTLFELLGFFPKLQSLAMNFFMCAFLKDDTKKRLPTIFPCLRTLKLSRIDLDNGIKLSCAYEMIMSFPNLQTLEIQSTDKDCESTPAYCSLEIDYNKMWLPQLQSVVFTYSSTSENEVSMVKYLLACSPVLKKMVIRSHPFLVSDEKFMFATKLMKLKRASHAVDIDLS